MKAITLLLFATIFLSVTVSAKLKGSYSYATSTTKASFPPLTLHKLASTDAGKCLDGTPGAYYIRTVAGSTDWMFYFEGGGWCYSPLDCLGRSKGSLGSSSSYSATVDDNFGGLLNHDTSVNPTFGNFNLVYMKYCDGNSFSGDRVDPVIVNGTSKLYFRGKHVREGIFAHVLANYPQIKTAKRFVQTGCSAGGLSTFLHSDAVGAWVKKNLPLVTSFVAIPISGFFLLETNVLNQPIYPLQMQSIFYLSNASSGVNQNCIQSLTPVDQWKCNFAEFSMSYSSVRTFVLNSEMDSWQGICILTSMLVTSNPMSNGNCSAAPGWQKCGGDLESCATGPTYQPVLDFQEKFRNRMYENAGMQRAGNGGYFSSCFTHCEAQGDGPWTQWKVGGKSMSQAVTDWYLGNPNAPAAQNTYRDCTLSLNNPHQCDSLCQ